MNIVGYGGGSNSTAMLIGMHRRGIPVDLILFSDTGGEQAHTYEYIPIMNQWLAAHGMPEITVVEYTDRNGDRLTLEQECLRSGTLPAIAYGYKKCSLKHKIGTQDKFCNNHPPCQEAWARGEKITKYIGFDAGEERRVTTPLSMTSSTRSTKRSTRSSIGSGIGRTVSPRSSRRVCRSPANPPVFSVPP